MAEAQPKAGSIDITIPVIGALSLQAQQTQPYLPTCFSLGLAMKELHGKVAVITGAASGFGREFAIRCADEGMKVILTDIDTGGLGTTVELLKPGTESLVIGSDVSSADSIEHLARSTYDRFGACHLLFNNAGVGTAGPIWTATLDDWKWTLGINVMGVVHGLRSFVPRMLAQKEESHIVNTASADLRSGAACAPGLRRLCCGQTRRGRDHGVPSSRAARPECADRRFRAMPCIC